MHKERDDDFVDRLANGLGNRLVNAVRHTIIQDTGLDHIPADRIAEWADNFRGIADFNGIEFDAGYFVARNGVGFTIRGNGRVVNGIVVQWMAENGLSDRFSFEIESHGMADELGNLPADAWPEYMPFGMIFEPVK